MAVRTTKSAPNPQQTRRDRLSVATAHDAQRNPTLVALGARLRTLRARRGMTRKATAQVAEVSERYLANLEQGSGNPSMLILEQLAGALGCRVAELVGDVTTSSAEWLLIRELLRNKSEGDLRHAREAIGARFRTGSGHPKAARVALIGLRGAGKSTLGKMLADELDVPFVELSREVERIAGGDIRQIHDMYGANAYRRYERRALEETVQLHSDAVISTPGGLVADPTTLNFLLEHSTTVWLQAGPEEHMQRVTRQGDLRPMAASTEAMDDLRRILAGRTPFYAKADYCVNTASKSLAESYDELRCTVRSALSRLTD